MTDVAVVSVSITGPDPDWLAAHARVLVERRLAACGNVIPGVRSIYRWGGVIHDEGEALLVVHTTPDRVDELMAFTNEVHPYDTVQILATAVGTADPAYDAWVAEATHEHPRSDVDHG